MEEVLSVYKDLYQHQTTNPEYDEIIDVLEPRAIKMLSEVELQKTESQITLEELSSCMERTCNNKAPGLLGFTGSFYEIN